MGRIGIYGGTFNPPHRGHIQAARQAVELLHLDRLLFVPDGCPPHKTMPEGSPPAWERLDLVRLAAQSVPKAEVSDLELAGMEKAIRPIRWSCCIRATPMTSCFSSWGPTCF